MSPKGQLMSPGYPARYPSNTTCRWVIALPSDYRVISFTFHRVYLEEDRNCVYVALSIKGRVQAALRLGRTRGLHKSLTTANSPRANPACLVGNPRQESCTIVSALLLRMELLSDFGSHMHKIVGFGENILVLVSTKGWFSLATESWSES